MAERLTDIVTQIQNVRQLGAVVTAMRGIAASRAQRGRSLLAGIEAYTDVVSRCYRPGIELAADGYDWPSAPLRACQTRPHPLLCRAGFCRSFQRARVRGRRGDLDGGHEHGRRHAWRSCRRRARNKARLVGGDDHARRWDPKFREPARRGPVWLPRPGRHHDGRYPLLAFGLAAASALIDIRCCRSISDALRARSRRRLR